MLRVRLLGGLTLDWDGRELRPPRAAAARALLGWLALNPGPQPRGELAARFWPDVLDESARQSLRNALWTLRRDLGPAADALVVDGDAISLADEVEVDARRLDAAIARGDAAAAAELAETGELLRGLDADWALQARDERRDGVSEALAALAADAADPAEAVAWARRRSRLDPLSEDAARDLMVRLDAAGDRAAALATYERLADRLRRELRVAPSRATRELAESLRAGEGEVHAARGDGGPRLAARGDTGPRLVARGDTGAPFVGRGPELAALIGEWGAARAGRGGAVVLEGEPGIGKSRLAAELARHAEADGGRVALGAAIELEGAAPLAPWAELLDALTAGADPLDPVPGWVGDLALLAPAAAARLAGAAAIPPAARTADVDRLRLYEAAVAAIAAAAQSRPLLLVLEDLHAADAPSLALLAHAGRRIRDLPVLALATTRSAAGQEALDHHLGATRIRLPALGRHDAAALVAATADDLDPAAVQRAVQAADGNPLLIVESARALAAGDDGPPRSLRATVARLLATLPPGARRVADLLAVAGRPLEAAELDAFAVEDATEAIATGLLEARDTALGFHHALLREAAYDALDPPRRRLLHEQVAEALIAAGDGRHAEIARHLRRAGRDARAVGHLAAAARAARDVVALGEARAYVREAIEIAPQDPDLWLLLSHIEALRGEHDAMRAASEEALARIGADRRRRGLALADRGVWLSSALCWPGEAIVDLREASDLLRGEADLAGERAAGLGALAWAEAVAGDPGQVEPLLAEADAIGAPDPHGFHHVHAVTARVNKLVREDRALEALELADELARIRMRPGWTARLGSTVWLEFASVAAYAGRFEQALAFADTCLAEQGPVLSKRIEGLAARAYILLRLDRRAEALATAEEMAAAAEQLDVAALARLDLGCVLCAVGEHQRGVAAIEAALDEGVTARRADARLIRAESLVALGRLQDAARELRRATLETVRPADQPATIVPRVSRIQALIAAAGGDSAEAVRLYDEAAGGWRRLAGEPDREAYMSNVVDLGRPPVAGLTEPARELARVEREREACLASTTRP